MAFTDDFSVSAAGTKLADSTPSGGTAWTVGTAGLLEFIISNSVEDTATQTNGPSSGPDTVLCDDQGSADHATIIKASEFSTAFSNTYAVTRLVDESNCCGYRLNGTGSLGRRLTKIIAGSVTDLITSQGVSGEWIKVEAEGDKYRFYSGGTGATPTWTQVGSEQTIANADLSTAETSQGLRSSNAIGYGSRGWISYFEADTLGAVGITGTGTPASQDSTASGTAAAETLAVTSLAPDTGAGGTAVTITGSNFKAGATVMFGANPATDVVVVNSTTITCVVPAAA